MERREVQVGQYVFGKLLAQMKQVFLREKKFLPVVSSHGQIVVNSFQKPIRAARRILLKFDKALDAFKLHAVCPACCDAVEAFNRILRVVALSAHCPLRFGQKAFLFVKADARYRTAR